MQTEIPGKFAVIIPAKNEADLLPATLDGLRPFSWVHKVIVVDDASDDATGRLAEDAGAVVLKRPRSEGKASALMQGADWALAEMSAEEHGLVFLDADAGSSVGGLNDLVDPVMRGTLDMAIAIYSARGATGGHGFVVRLAVQGIRERTGWTPTIPLSGIRAMTASAYRAVRPLARGWGVETAMTIDALRAGLRVAEVPTSITHRPTGSDWRAQWHRARQWWDVRRALAERAP